MNIKPVSMIFGGALVMAVAGCAVTPVTMPSVAVMPAPGKSFEEFQAEDYACRNAAYQSGGGGEAAQAGTNNAVGTAVAGTAIGAAGGALLGSAGGNAGGGAAIGAGVGLLAGSLMGGNSAGRSQADLQHRYDTTYVQCMSSKGNVLPPAAPQPTVVYHGYVPPPVYVGPGYYYGRPYYHYGYRGW